MEQNEKVKYVFMHDEKDKAAIVFYAEMTKYNSL